MFGSSSSHVLEARVEASGVDKFESKMSSAGGAVTSFEKKALAAGGALAAISAGGIAKSISAASDLNATLTESQAIMGDLTQDQMKGMEDAAREVGRTTTFSAAEAGEAFYFLASAGMDAEQSMAAVGDVAQFAQAGAFDLATATDLATDAQSALGLSAEDAAENQENLNRVMDTLVKSNQLANASVEEFSSALTNKAAAAMRSAGIEIEEGASALATFADQGLKGNRAGTILARTIQGLQSSAQKNEEAFEQLGVSVYDAEGNMRPMADIVEDLEGGLEGMSTEQRNAAMSQLGLNERAAQGLGLMMGNSEAMREYEGELRNAGGAAEEVANNQLQSFRNQLDLMKSQFLDIGISIGNVFLPYLTRLVSGVTSVAKRFAEFNDRTDGLAGAITLVSGLISGLTMMGWALSSMLGTGLIPAAGSAAAAIAAIAAPVVAVSAVIGGLAYAWKTNFAGMRDSTQEFAGFLGGNFRVILMDITNLATTVLGTFQNVWEDSTGAVENRVASFIAFLKSSFHGPLETMSEDIQILLLTWEEAWRENSDAIEARLSGFVSSVGSFFGQIIDHIGPVVAFVRDVFQEVFESAFESIVSIGQTLFDLVVSLGQRFGILGEDVNTLAEVLGQLLDPFRKIELAVSGVDEVIGTLATTWDEDWMGIQTTTQEATTRISTLLGGMEGDSEATFTGIQENVQTQFVGALTRMREETLGTSSVWTQEMTTMGSSMSETFGLLWRILDEIVAPVMAMITEVFGTHMGRMLELTRVHLGPLIAEFMETLTHLNENIVQPILEAILVVWDAFGDEIMTIMEFVFDTISLVVTNALDVILTTIRVFLAVLRGDWGDAWNLVAGLLERIFGRMLDFVSGWGVRFLDWLGGLIGDIIGWFEDLARRLIGGSIIPEMLSDILSAFFGFRSDVFRWLGNLVGDFVSDVSSLAGDVVSEFESMGQDALDAITSIDFVGAGRSMVSDLASGIKENIPDVGSAASSAADKIRSYYPGSDAEQGPLDDITSTGPALTDVLAEGMLSNLRKVQRAAETVASTAQPDVDHVASRAAAAAASRTRRRGQAAGDYFDITVDARGADDPRQVERSAERGLSKALDAYNVPR